MIGENKLPIMQLDAIAVASSLLCARFRSLGVTLQEKRK